MQVIQDIVKTILTPTYPQIVAPMIFHLLNKCFANHNTTFSVQRFEFNFFIQIHSCGNVLEIINTNVIMW